MATHTHTHTQKKKVRKYVKQRKIQSENNGKQNLAQICMNMYLLPCIMAVIKEAM